MRNEVQTKLLKGIRILDITCGPSGAYAAWLLNQSGATIRKGFKKTSSKYLTYSELPSEPELLKLLKESWDLVIWDSHLGSEIDRILLSYFDRKNGNKIGVRIQFPEGVTLEEEEDLQAFGGWMELTGDPQKEPLKIGGNPATCLLGAHVATGGILALVENNTIGRVIEVSVPTILASALEGAYSRYVNTGVTRTRTGNGHNKLVPMAILPVLDGWEFIGAPVDEQWALLERWANLPHKPEWASTEDRYTQRRLVEERLAGWSRNMAGEDLFLTGQAFRLPFAKVQSMEDIYNCPHLKERKFWNNKKPKLPWKVIVNKCEFQSGLKEKPLNKIRILDMTSMWSGPYCARLFADLGLEVIKIEAPHRPDGIRPIEGDSAPFFSELNRNKRSIAMNLLLDEEKQHFIKLVENSEVLIENFSPRVMGNLGLSDDQLWEINPELVIVSLSAFGQTGPYRDFIGYGPTIESMSGLASLTGYEEGSPWLPGFSVSDIGAGIHGALALVSALIYRQNHGVGIKVDVSQYEVACQFVAHSLFDHKSKRLSGGDREGWDMTSFFGHDGINSVSLEDGLVTLGAPWTSHGWMPGNRPPPELNEHRSLILQTMYELNNC